MKNVWEISKLITEKKKKLSFWALQIMQNDGVVYEILGKAITTIRILTMLLLEPSYRNNVSECYIITRHYNCTW